MKYFRSWRSHHGANKSAILDKKPWISFSAIHFLELITKKHMTVFEYGSGGSTLFWVSRIRHLTSIEHDRSWYERMQNILGEQQIKNIDYILTEPIKDNDINNKDFRDADAYISSDVKYSGKTFDRYVKTIDLYPDAYFDIIMIDGRARPSCIKHAIQKLKSNGYLVVDNSERKYYLSSFNFEGPGWVVKKFAGPVPYSYDFSETTILKKLI